MRLVSLLLCCRSKYLRFDSSEGGITIPESGIMPLNGGMLTVEGGVTPSEGGMMHSEGSIIPSKGGTTIPEGGNMPSEGGVLTAEGCRSRSPKSASSAATAPYAGAGAALWRRPGQGAPVTGAAVPLDRSQVPWRDTDENPGDDQKHQVSGDVTMNARHDGVGLVVQPQTNHKSRIAPRDKSRREENRNFSATRVASPQIHRIRSPPQMHSTLGLTVTQSVCAQSLKGWLGRWVTTTAHGTNTHSSRARTDQGGTRRRCAGRRRAAGQLWHFSAPGEAGRYHK